MARRSVEPRATRDASAAGAAAGARPTLVWFRHDLRLSDHPALTAALARGKPVIPVYIWSPEEEDADGGDASANGAISDELSAGPAATKRSGFRALTTAPGAASRWWLHQSLTALQASLRAMDVSLLIRRGPCAPALRALAAETNADTVMWTRRYEPAARAIDARVNAVLAAAGIATEVHSGSLLFEPEAVTTGAGGPFQVFTPFWRACLARADIAAPLPAPTRAAWRATHAHAHTASAGDPQGALAPASLPLSDLKLEPTIDWAAGMRATWRPGEAGAHQRLRAFVTEHMGAYADARDVPAAQGTSRLSPHLHHGEISPRQIWNAAHERATTEGDAAIDPYLREVGWREFAHHLLFHFPRTVRAPLRPAFARFPWARAPAHLEAWKRGRTGYPLIDAGMRELWATGFVHNRVRMVVASFLTKHLLQPWQVGAAWFWDTLVDADLANNTLGWQWVTGCGADAAPYFRIFNPVAQAQKFDPTGAYVRRWVPALARLPDRYVQTPWDAPADVARAAGVVIGKSYPARIVDHAWARARALAAYASLDRPNKRALVQVV